MEIVEKTKRIEIEEQEVKRNAKVLEATIHEPAMAEAYRICQVAEGEKYGFFFNYLWVSSNSGNRVNYQISI